MQYNIAQLLKAQIGSDLAIQLDDELDLESVDEIIVEPVVGDLRFQHTNQGILVTGECETTVELQCARCLEPFDLPIKIELDELYRPTVDVASGMPLRNIDDGDDSFTIDEHHHIDLGDAIRQQILLTLPMQPICREDCRGLCPTCGVNRNTTPCSCETDLNASANSHPFGSLANLNIFTESP